MQWVRGVSAAASLVALSTLQASAEIVTGTVQIIDGDTMSIGEITIRLNGIDAAETGQKCNLPSGAKWECADAAADRLTNLVGDGAVQCDAHGDDRYGRIIATCFVDGVDIGRQLVEEGLVWAFVKYDPVYGPEEAAARTAQRGIWQAPTDAPWDYRADRWSCIAEGSPRPGCPIKGNISKSGERIYHTPWSRSYKATQIREENGERWFCDEAEAIRAGWRAPRSR